jgi:hypothetical protein
LVVVVVLVVLAVALPLVLGSFRHCHSST